MCGLNAIRQIKHRVQLLVHRTCSEVAAVARERKEGTHVQKLERSILQDSLGDYGKKRGGKGGRQETASHVLSQKPVRGGAEDTMPQASEGLSPGKGLVALPLRKSLAASG